jgi:pyridoxal phosphate enzyme (YggS family)
VSEPPAVPEADAARAAELSANLTALRARIDAACAAAGRPAADVTLVAVTKFFPASDVVALRRLGVSDVGENRDQEAAPKATLVAALGVSVTWHFVGQLQANKAASVVSYADVVHSVDRPGLVSALSRRAVAAGRAEPGRALRCLIQVSLDGAAGRGGAQPGEVPALAEAIAAADGLALDGVMAVAPLGAPPRPAFARLADIADMVRAAHPGARAISAGMSSDLEDAIAEGATLVRIGTALLGGRRAFVR